MSPGVRTILHVDMDAFFASVEQRDHPELRGMPVLVGGEGRRGVVAAASYEARAFGCHSAMPSAIAKRLCPQAVFVPGSHKRYRAVSKEVFAIFERFTPLVQPISIDEAFLDVTGTEGLFDSPIEIAHGIRRMVFEGTRLTCSVGVAPNKFLAKLGSEMNKPDGLMVIEQSRIHEVLDPMPADAIPGVGPATMKSLGRLGVRTIGDIRRMPLETLRARLGEYGSVLHRYANGVDDRPVRLDRGAKSISHEQTFETDLKDPDEVRAMIARQAEDVAYRLRRHARFARTVTIKVRFGDFETVTRSVTLDQPSDQTAEIHRAARGLFDRWAAGYRPVRLIGVGVSQLTQHADSGGLFDQETNEVQRRVDRVGDVITERFGKDSVMRGSSMRARARHGAHGPGSDTGGLGGGAG
ncbi:MAG: DNA polymerase IV [Phycisphaerales bacterium]|nr:DNA polymerase IV [Phycisphaerales bacterium]